jgi:allantoin racemase
MRILIINPNTSEDFTRKIAESVQTYANTSSEVVTMTAESGPRSIECVYDELLSAQGTLEVFLSQKDQFDGFIFACYSDHPVVYAAREITEKPVMGIAEASMHMACLLGHRFSIVTTNDEWEPLLWDAVRHYGLESRCASIRSTGLLVLALEGKSDGEVQSLIEKAARLAVEDDGAEVICLGCAGMTGLDKRLEKAISVPVLDGVVCALKIMEGLIAYRAQTSKVRTYSRPQEKELVDLKDIFREGYQ